MAEINQNIDINEGNRAKGAWNKNVFQIFCEVDGDV